MKRLVYTPKINAWINTDFGIIDVSEFIVSSTIERKINQVSSATLVLRNPKKEDGKMLFTEHLLTDGSFGPLLHAMDPIIISLTRLKDRSIQVFTGYCDKTPYLQLYAGTVQVDASCTLKRLQYTYWDPGLPFTREFLAEYGWFPDSAHGGIQNSSATTPSTPGTPSAPGSPPSIPHGPKSGRVLVPGAGDKQHGHVTKKFAIRQGINQLPGHKPQDVQHEQQTPVATPTILKQVWMIEMAGPDAAEVMIDYFTGEVLQWETNGVIYRDNRWSTHTVIEGEGEGESLANRPVTSPVNFQDGSIGMLLMGVLQNVGGWDASTIYIEPLPAGIGVLVANLFKQFQSSVSENQTVQGAFADLLSDLIGANSLGGGLKTTTTTTPGTPSSTTPVPGLPPNNLKHYSPAQISAIAQHYRAPKWLADAIGRTSVPESNGNPRAFNSSTATGLLQIRASAWTQLSAKRLFEPYYNIQSALYVVSQQGSIAWSASGTWRGPAVPKHKFHFPLPK